MFVHVYTQMISTRIIICFVFQMNSHMCFDLNQVWIYITYYIINSLIKSIIIKKFGKINN